MLKDAIDSFKSKSVGNELGEFESNLRAEINLKFERIK